MSKFGWSLPPGCTQQHIDEAYGGDDAAASFSELLWEQCASLGIDEEKFDDFAEWVFQQMGQAYKHGYDDGMATEALFHDTKKDK